MKQIVIVFILFFLTGFAGQDVVFAEEYSLDDLYRIALERSERIKISEEDLYIVSRDKDRAEAALIPDFSAFVNYTRYTEDKLSSTGLASQPVVIQPDNSASWGLRLDQSFSLSGREFTAFRVSKENIEKSRYDLYSVKESYLFTLSSAYFDVLRAEKSVEIARANVERLTKHRDAARTRLKVGEVTKTALLRAEAELSGRQSELVRAENGLQLSKAALATIAGINKDFTLKEEPMREPEGILSLDALQEEALSERAELKVAELKKRIAGEEVKYAKGAYWPSLSIEGVYSRRDEDPASVFLNKESIYGGLKFNFPFYEGGMKRAEARQAEAKNRQAELIYEDMKKRINIEVEGAYLDLMTQGRIIKSLEDQLAFAGDNYNAVSKQFQYGLADSIDVMDANTLLVSAERELANAGFNYRLAVLKLRLATGTLLKEVLSSEVSAAN
ncbi:MAG: TolC family protein [Nitrospirae bacterium]|nr:TolC family protein [Nitrospirota bacterium]